MAAAQELGAAEEQELSALGAEEWRALDDDEWRDLAPLPPDPLEGVEAAEEPPWSEHWLESAEGGADEWDAGGPDHLPSDMLAGITPGLFLTAELEATDPREVDEYHLVELIAGYQRVAAWSQWRMTQLAGCLSRREALNPRSSLPTGDYVMNVTAQELAPRLGISKFAARRMVENGRMFGMKLEDTGIALAEGRIDYPKACAIARMLKDQPDDVAWAVQQEILPHAGLGTITQLEREVSKAIIAIDPIRATARHKKAREQRRVHHPRPLPDGMASMTAILPATDAAALDLALEAAARTAKASGDTRTLDQLRADAVALLGHGALEYGFIGVPPASPGGDGSGPENASSDGAVPPKGPSVQERVPCEGGTADGAAAACDADAGVLADGPDPESDEQAGSEPAEAPAAEPAEESLSDGGAPAAPNPPPAPPDPGAPTFHTGNSFLRTPCMPIGSIGGRRAQVKVTVPLSVLIPFEQLEQAPDRTRGDTRAPSDGTAARSGPVSTCRCGAAAPPGESSPLDDDGLPEDWYYGPPVEVAELDGYGPITPDVARALAHSGGTWQRLVTDPLSGALLDVGRTRYRPPAAIADFVRNRDGHCVVPACSTPAESCQLDHIDGWAFGGITSAATLATMCPNDHAGKTTGAFELRHLGDGDFLWTTPTGHRYLRDRFGRVTALGRAGAGDGDAQDPFAADADLPF